MFYNTTNNNTVLFASPYGVYTPTAAIPAAGKATYTGIAFDHSERGNFTPVTGSNLDYGLTFFRIHAEEIAGFTVNGGTDGGIALHGTRGAITE